MTRNPLIDDTRNRLIYRLLFSRITYARRRRYARRYDTYLIYMNSTAHALQGSGGILQVDRIGPIHICQIKKDYSSRSATVRHPLDENLSAVGSVWTLWTGRAVRGAGRWRCERMTRECAHSAHTHTHDTGAPTISAQRGQHVEVEQMVRSLTPTRESRQAT